MMMFVIQLIVIWLLLIVLFTSADALGGLAFGIELEEVSFGTGNAIFRRGKLKIGAIPIGGYVRLKDTREKLDDEPDDFRHAFNHKPRVVQALTYLSGCALMALLAALVLAGEGISQVTEGFRHMIVGALAPKSTAQEYIQATHALWIQHGFLTLLGVMAAKVAAFNLLPLPHLNGGQAILALAGVHRVRHPQWLLWGMQISVALTLALICSWAYALVLFLGAKS